MQQECYGDEQTHYREQEHCNPFERTELVVIEWGGHDPSCDELLKTVRTAFHLA